MLTRILGVKEEKAKNLNLVCPLNLTSIIYAIIDFFQLMNIAKHLETQLNIAHGMEVRAMIYHAMLSLILLYAIKFRDAKLIMIEVLA